MPIVDDKLKLVQNAATFERLFNAVSTHPDTGTKFFKDDLTWDTVPKQFQSVVTVAKTGYADFVCADATYASDDQCIQAAIDYATLNSIKELWIFDGIYNFITPVTSSSNINIRGFGNVIFNESSLLSDDFLSFAGSVTKTVSALGDVVTGASSITVDDISDIAIGDLVIIYDNVIWGSDYPTFKTGEIHEISGLSGATSPYTISFRDGLIHSYTTAQAAQCIILSPITSNVENIKFAGISSTASKGAVSFLYGKNCTVKNCTINKTGLHGVVFTDSFNCSVTESKISNCEWAGNGYGVSISNACAHISVSANRIANCRHCVASGGTESRGQPRDYNIYDNTFFGGSNHIIDAHACVESIYVHNNTFYGVKYILTSGAKITSFQNNTVYGGYGCNVRGATTDMEYVVESNEFHDSSILSTAFDTVVLKHVSVKNNKVYNGPSNIINIVSTESITISDNYIDSTLLNYTINVNSATRGIVSNNTIRNSSRSGIILNACSGLLVHDNIINNSDISNSASDGYDSGILLYNSNNITVHNNKITDVNGYQRYGIKESEISNNNKIVNNDITAGTVAKIRRVGTGTIVRDNHGFNPVGNFTAPSIPSSTTAYTNSYGYPCMVSISGGTVSAISIDGVTTGHTSDTVILSPGETIAITYSSAPTWKWWGL